MIVTRNGLDIYQVTTGTEAEKILAELSDRTSLSKKEITNIVSFSGLSVSDTVKVYNRFTREGSDGKIRSFAA